VPEPSNTVHNDCCVMSMDTPLFPKEGLYVSLENGWKGYGKPFVDVDVARHETAKAVVYLHINTTLVATTAAAAFEKDEEGEEPTKLAVGVEGGFDGGKDYDEVKEYQIAVVPCVEGKPKLEAEWFYLPLDELSDLPQVMGQTVLAIIDHKGAEDQAAVMAWEAGEEERAVSKYANDLPQEEVTKKISPNPSDWYCEKSGDRENLWLNLSDGYIGGGRRNWDGSGGSNGALEHYLDMKQQYGKVYPLVVKLGTITPNGADVFSYAEDEDCMVTDPQLAAHLAHWGIDVMKMSKTDKSMAEMEVELNKEFAFDRITEAGKELDRVRGPGMVGLRNLGNSCYINSFLQLVFSGSVDALSRRYRDDDGALRRAMAGEGALENEGRPQRTVLEVSKLANALNGNRYCPPIPEEEEQRKLDPFNGMVAPVSLRKHFGMGHPDFSSSAQQDAAEYLLYFLEKLNRAEMATDDSFHDGLGYSTDRFGYVLEDRLECPKSGTVKYSTRRESLFPLIVSMDDAMVPVISEAVDEDEGEAKRLKTTDDEKDEKESPPPVVPFDACLRRTMATGQVEGFRSPALNGEVVTALKNFTFLTMPEYLLIQVSRYYVDSSWQLAKLNCSVPMPMELNLEKYHNRSPGLQEGEKAMPDSSAAAAVSPAVASEQQAEPDAEIMVMLMSMGFDEDRSKRACLKVGNSSADAAASWLMEHLDDPPTPTNAETTAEEGATVDSDSLIMLTSMGFTDRQAKAAMKATGNNVERAADWLFSRTDDLDAAVEGVEVAEGQQQQQRAAVGGASNESRLFEHDGKGVYDLIGFISHVGRNVSHGHYVCHMLKEVTPGGGPKKWVIFNDEKVAISADPPFDLGYIYLYKRRQE
ncbi:Ubiquitin carboxyl-terminal hydrolase 13, partial [Perkinsus chesapeaki]